MVDTAVAEPRPASAALRQHVEETVRLWLGVLPAADVPELPPRLTRLLVRAEELERRRRDAYGCWDFGLSRNFHEGRLWVPEIDRWLAERRSETANGGREPLWPRGHAFAACLTHDVDLVSTRSTARQVLRFARAGFERTGSGFDEATLRIVRPAARVGRGLARGVERAPATADTLELSVDVEQELGVVGTYFFAVWERRHPSRFDCVYDPDDPCRFRGSRRTVAEVAQEIAREGFDVGLHGSFHSAFDGDLLAAQRGTLEQATGLTVRTTRQHFLRWDVRATPRAQAAAGLTADSTLGFNRNVGFRAGTSLPYDVFDVERDRRVGVLELPLVIQDGALLRDDALGLDLDLALELVERLTGEIAAVGGVVTLLFHPNNLEHEDYRILYKRSIELLLERGAWVTSLSNIERWWREREQRLRRR